ncbi:MAG: biopolymer transporter ExbD [Burkholderiales bacterium]|nr:biopolymer transporter ExbD [Burkholderiales bacterium]
MDFRRGRERESVEINLISMIDVLLVIVIFLAVTTSFSQIAQLQITLPTAQAEKPAEQPAAVNVAVDAAGRYVVNGKPFVGKGAEALSQALRQAAGGQQDPMIVISADANATHQSVINVMEAARLAGYARITFATQSERR